MTGVQLRDGRTVARRRGDRHHRDIPERPGACRRDEVQLRAQRRGAVATARRPTAHAGPAVDAPEDRNAAAAGRPHHRLDAVRSAAGRCRAHSVLVPDRAKIDRPQIQCHIGYTTEETRRILREAIPRSPLYSGQIEGIGPRYCPSIEDKIVKFPDKVRHQIFLEPEGLDTNEVYVNGMSTSMPIDVQAAMVASIPGLEDAEMIRPGLRHRVRCDRPAGTGPYPGGEGDLRACSWPGRSTGLRATRRPAARA